jgi:hypothetical protein
VLDRRGVERAVNEAEVLRLFDGAAVEEVLARARGRRGAAILSSVLADFDEPVIADGELAERFLLLCREAGLPDPATEQWLVLDDGGPALRADFLWPEARLVVETDGRSAHGTRRAFERDRRRDQRLIVAGYRVVRFTWRQITREPALVAATVRRLLAH